MHQHRQHSTQPFHRLHIENIDFVLFQREIVDQNKIGSINHTKSVFSVPTSGNAIKSYENIQKKCFGEFHFSVPIIKYHLIL